MIKIQSDTDHVELAQLDQERVVTKKIELESFAVQEIDHLDHLFFALARSDHLDSDAAGGEEHAGSEEAVKEREEAAEAAFVGMPLQEPAEEVEGAAGVAVGAEDLGDVSGAEAGELGALAPPGAGEGPVGLGDEEGRVRLRGAGKGGE